MKFLDNIDITIKAGNGGDGSASFRHAKFVEFGGPDGGDGGRGGNVIFEAKNNINTLIDFKFKTFYQAQNGQNGRGKQQNGEKGKDLVLFVPIGTEIYEEGHLLYDLKKEGDTFIAAFGGRGGRGNLHFKTSTNRAPRRFDKGEIVNSKNIHLEMKLIADIGIIGFPNAGKSTFLSAITNAKPKIGDYDFTTLYPNLGVYSTIEKDIIFADIPGLIKGASEGYGLGDKFLAHIERCKLLIHMIDGSNENAIERYDIINNEIKNYKDGILLSKAQIIVINKIDKASHDNLKLIRDFFVGKKIFEISAKEDENISQLINFCLEQLN